METNDMSRKDKIELLKAAQRGDRTALIDVLSADKGLSLYMDDGNGHYTKDGNLITQEEYEKAKEQDSKNRRKKGLFMKLVGGDIPLFTSEKEALAYYERQDALTKTNN